jgi:hypothetical protein
MNKQPKHHTPEEKVATLRRRLLEQEPLSKIMNWACSPRSSTAGTKSLRERGGACEQKRPSNHSAEQERIAYLEKKIVDFVRRWSEKTEIGAGRFIEWLDITASKFYDWRERYGKVNEHCGWVPRDFWLEEWEKQAIAGFHLKNLLEGYRRRRS